MYLNGEKAVKKTITLLVIFTLLVCSMTTGLVSAADYLETPLVLSRALSDSSLMVNQPFTVNYKVVPQTVSAVEQVQKDKEFFIVIDTSGSMDDKLDGVKRINIAKAAANAFLDKLKDKSGVKAGLISYDNLATIEKNLTTDLESIKTAVNGLQVGGGTNIGDGLRRAYYKLLKSSNTTAEKYIILLTDGEPTYHSVKNGKLMMDDGIADDFNGGGDHATYNDTNYCYRVATELIEPSDIKSYMIAFTAGSNKNILETVAQKAGGAYKQALTSTELTQVYDEIYTDIVNDISLQNVVLRKFFRQGLKWFLRRVASPQTVTFSPAICLR